MRRTTAGSLVSMPSAVLRSGQQQQQQQAGAEAWRAPDAAAGAAPPPVRVSQPTREDLLLPSRFCTASLEGILALVAPVPPACPPPAALLGEGHEVFARCLGLGPVPPTPEGRIAHWQRLVLVARLAALACTCLWSTGDPAQAAERDDERALDLQNGRLRNPQRALAPAVWRWADPGAAGSPGPRALPPAAGPRSAWLLHIAGSVLSRWTGAVSRIDARPALQFQALAAQLECTLKRAAKEAAQQERRARRRGGEGSDSGDEL